MFKEYPSLNVVLVWGGLQRQTADRNNDILVGVASVASNEEHSL